MWHFQISKDCVEKVHVDTNTEPTLDQQVLVETRGLIKN